MGASAKTVDMSTVKERGAFNPKRVAEGDYAAKIVKVEDSKVKESGDFMYVFTIKLDKYSQYSYPYRCKLEENQLWKLRNILVAAGLNVPKKRMKVDPNKAVGKSIGVTMEDDEYEGRPKSEVNAVFPVSELADGIEIGTDDADDDDFDEESAPQIAGGDDDEADEEPKPKKKKDKGKKSKAEPEPEPEPAKGDKKKKKGKKKKDDDENVEDIDISDV